MDLSGTLPGAYFMRVIGVDGTVRTIRLLKL
jgi:hypothetical protein